MNEPSEPQPKWHCRVTQTHGTSDRKTGMTKREVIAELVWGHEHTEKGRNDVTLTTIVGEVFHKLTGPTAEQSISEVAEQYNRAGKKPPESKPVRTRLDGFKQGFRNAGGESLFSPQTLKETISYDPHKK